MPSKSGYSDFYRKPLRKAQDYYSNAPTLPTVGGFARMPTSAYADQATQGAPLGSYAREYYRQRYPTQGTVFNPSYGVRAHPVSIGAGLPAAPRPMIPQAPIENSQADRQALTQDQLTQAGAVSTIPAGDFYAKTGRLGAVVQAGDEQTRPAIMAAFRQRMADTQARQLPPEMRGELIRQKAQFETAQRQARMAGFTPQASYLLGQGNPDVTNAMMFGPRYAADLAQTGAFNNRTMADYDLGRGDLDLRRGESAYGMSPEGQRAAIGIAGAGAGVPFEQTKPYMDSVTDPNAVVPSGLQPQGSPLPMELQGLSGGELYRTAKGIGYTDEQILPWLRMMNPYATIENPDKSPMMGALESTPQGRFILGATEVASPLWGLYQQLFGEPATPNTGLPGGAPATPRTAPPTPNRSPSDQRRRNRR